MKFLFQVKLIHSEMQDSNSAGTLVKTWNTYFFLTTKRCSAYKAGGPASNTYPVPL